MFESMCGSHSKFRLFPRRIESLRNAGHADGEVITCIPVRVNKMREPEGSSAFTGSEERMLIDRSQIGDRNYILCGSGLRMLSFPRLVRLVCARFIPMTAVEKPQSMTVAQYLEAEPLSDVRHEYLGGDVYAMGGASARHNIISLNIASSLRSQLRGGPCTTFIHDMKVRLFADRDTYFYYPDVMVACDPADNALFYRHRPSIIVEVMSDSTARIDRREKLFAYRTIPEFTQYVLVDQERIEVTNFTRSEQGWTSEILTAAPAVLEFKSIGASISLSEIYESSGVAS